MKIKILDSGSKANCALLTDCYGNQLLLDCGVKYDRLLLELNWDKPCICLITHEHGDHYNPQTIDRIKSFGVDIFTNKELQNGKAFSCNGYNILPIELPHDKDCNSFAFLIFSCYEGKSIFFATDCTRLPNIANKKFHLLMIENNYDEQTVFAKRMSNSLHNLGYTRHLSTEYVLSWLSKRTHKAENVIITHLSNSGNIQANRLRVLYEPYADNIYLAKENLSVEF